MTEAGSLPGSLVVSVEDRRVGIEMAGGGSWELPVGPLTLVEGPLADDDPPPPESLTNALGLVADHLDDVLIDAPIVAAATSVTAVGAHATVLARVELGHDDVPDDYVLTRAAADEVFRTIAGEPSELRRHNPGLPASDVESILGTCCVILGVMRRLELGQVDVRESV